MPLSIVTPGSRAPAARASVGRYQTLIQQCAATFDKAFKIRLDANRQGAALLQVLQGL
jgi:hypothetical protein